MWLNGMCNAISEQQQQKLQSLRKTCYFEQDFLLRRTKAVLKAVWEKELVLLHTLRASPPRPAFTGRLSIKLAHQAAALSFIYLFIF